MIDFSGIKKLTIGGVELKLLFINGVQVWKSGPTNLVPTAIDTDGSIYNGVGYKAGYRYNSSGNIVAYPQTTMTGFMLCNGVNDGFDVYCKGFDFTNDNLYNGIAFFDDDFNILFSSRIKTMIYSPYYAQGANYLIQAETSTIEVSDGITKMHINVNEQYNLHNKVKYIRLYAPPTDEEIIVTFNEEIE